jgi:hypothetical protein
VFEEVVELGYGQARRTLRASSPVRFRVLETSARVRATVKSVAIVDECVDHAARAGEPATPALGHPS